MDYTILDELMKTQKKGDSSKEKKNLYKDQMVMLLISESFSSCAQKYIKEGFPFCGAEMIEEFFSALNDNERKEEYTKLFRSKLFEENERGIAYKIAVHLMALELKKLNPDNELLKQLITIIPIKNIGREGEPLKDSSKIIEKYYLKELKNTVELYSLSKVGIESGYVVAFCKHINNAMNDITASRALPQESLDKIKQWAKEQDPSFVADETSREKENTTSRSAESNSGSTPAKNEISIEETKQFFDSVLVQMQKMQASRRGLRKRAKELSEIISEKDDQIKILQKKNEILESQLKNNNVKLSEQIAINDSLVFKQKELIETIKNEEVLIDGLNEEISRLKTINSVYSADKASSQNEQLNAIASKLKTEYQDFCDAENMDMDVELGENFRYQLRTIFKILKKAGIDVERR